MAVYQDTIAVSTAAGRPDFIDIKQQVIDIIAASGISNGTVTCQTTHTTCSVIFEEYVHDTNWQGQEFLQGDLIRFVDKMIPREVEEDRDYRYPGPKHVQFLVDYHNEHPEFLTAYPQPENLVTFTWLTGIRTGSVTAKSKFA